MNADHRRVIVALDFPATTPAFVLLDQLTPNDCRVKIGKELFTRAGPDFFGSGYILPGTCQICDVIRPGVGCFFPDQVGNPFAF